ncbi:MAG: ribonuclease HI [Deltaproteobacteria bacterium]|nr:ribonuclease HI [Deltaproteobacteria bacterium]
MSWRMASIRNQRVYARCDESGAFIVENGRVEIRYRPDDGRAYYAAERNLVAIEDEGVFPDDACVASTPSGVGARAMKTETSPKPKRVQPSASFDQAVIAYTDGACTGNPGPAGFGIVLKEGKTMRERFNYIGRATNNIAELEAIKNALTALDEPRRAVRIYTDSRYAIGVLTQGWRAKANQALVAEIRSMLARFSDLRLIHVPGHRGNPLNERADALARRAIREQASSDWIVFDHAK